MSRQGTSLPRARWARRLGLAAFFVAALLISQVASGISVGLTAPTSALAVSGLGAHPNRFDPAATQKGVNHLPRPPATPGPKPAYSPPHQFVVPMQPALVPLDPASGAHFVGSDGVLELSVAAGAVTASDVQAAGGKLSLLVRQVLPASGSNAGGSGKYSFGTWLMQLVDASGRPVQRGLRQPLAVKLHEDRRAGALDLRHTRVEVNPALPSWMNLDPASVPVKPAAPASGARQSSPAASGGSAPTVKPALGSASQQTASLDASTTTLSASVALASPSTAMSFDTDAPVATFGRPDPFETDLSAGALSAGIQLDLPAGPGGLTPPLTLAYNSSGVNDQHNPQGAAPWVGEGWSLGLGAISWAEHNVQTVCIPNCPIQQWEDSWQLSDAYGTAADLVPPNINVSTYTDDSGNAITASPVTWHTAPETRAKVISFQSPSPPSGMTPAPPCYRVFLPSGVMEEFGCTSDSLQWYPQPSGNNAGRAYIANWLLDLITDPQGNQVHVTYQQDLESASGVTYPRDAVLSTVEYDSPGCHDAQVMCTGSNWAPLMRVSFSASHAVTHVSGSGCAANGSLRCDDPVDESGSGGLPAPTVQSTFVLNDAQVQVRSSGSGAWNTLRDYRFSYDQGAAPAPNPITDPVTGTQESIAGRLLLTGLQVIGADGATALPARTFGYSTVTEYYEDSLGAPQPSSNCGPSWNNGNTPNGHTGCILWSQSYAANSYYLTSVSNGLGLAESFSWTLARNNFHGVVSGSNADPFACNNPSLEPTFPCNMPDDGSWSRAVLTQRSDSVVRLSQNGQGGSQTSTTVTSSWNYTYQVPYPLLAPECSLCVATFYWGNQNDFDLLDFYNGKFFGFAQTSVQLPDNAVEVHKFHTTEGWGLYDTSQISCDPINNNTTCTGHNDSYADLNNAAHGHEYELDRYATDGTTLLQQVKTRWGAACPPPGVSGTPASSTYGNWDGGLVTELDHSNPVMVCEVHPLQVDRYTYDGTSGQPVHSATQYTYDGLGREASQNQLANASVVDSSGHGNLQAFLSGGVTEQVPGLVSGDSDTAMGFDGSTGTIGLNLAGIDTTAAHQVTVEFWMKWSGSGSYLMPFGFNMYDLFLSTPVGFGFNTGNSDVYGVPASAVPANTPVHVVAVFTNGAVSSNQLYLNGVQQTLTQLAGTPLAPSVTATANISHWPTNPNYYFSGTLDEVAVYNGALSASRVSAHYNAGSGYRAAVLADSPMSYYRLDDGAGGPGPNTIVHKPQYVQNDSVTASSTSATGHYLIDYPAFDDVEDTSGNRYQCSYNSYDGQGFQMGQFTGLTLGEVTTADRYTDCGNSGNGFFPSGMIRTTHAFDLFGNQVARSDPDANAGVPGHAGCTVGSTAYSNCTSVDGTFGMLPVSTSNALSQASSTGYQVAASATGGGGFGLWPISTTNPNGQSTTTVYDALGRTTSETQPPVDGCPAGWSCADVGSPILAGSQGLSGGTWTLQGTGGDIWGTSDQFHLVSQSLAGDGAVSARVVSQASTDVWAKAGVMLRQTADSGSAYYAAEVTPGNGIVVQYRSSAGAAATMPVNVPGMAPTYLQVVRSGSSFSAYASIDGTNWTYLPGSAATLSVSGAMLAGLAVASHNTGAAAPVTFDSVAITSGSCPLAWSCADVQTPFPAGSQSVSGGGWTVQSGTGDIWSTTDQFHYVWQSLAGDGAVSAQVTTENSTDPWAKAGVMIRQTSDPSSAYYAALVTPGNGVVVQYRASAGTSAVTVATLGGTAPVFLRVDRSGTSFSASTSSDGVTWTTVPSSSTTLSVSGTMLAGVAVSGHNSSNAAGISDVYVGATPPAAATCPPGWSCADVGTAPTAGTQSVSGGSWTVNSSGFDIWGTSDQFHYVWQSLAGDGTLSGRVASQGSSDPWAKAGLMLRQSSDPASAYYAVEATPGNGIVVQYRASAGASAMMAAQLTGAAPTYVRVVREGSTFSAAISGDGATWTSIVGSTVTLSVNGTMLAGLAVSSHSSTTPGTATFDTLTFDSAPSTATVTTAYTVWCSGTAAQTPCVEVDKTQRLNSTTTVTSRAFYDGLGHLVETRSPAPGGQDVVRYSFYDASQRLAFQSVPYLVSAYTGGPGSAAYSIPDSTQSGTIYDLKQNAITYGEYDGLGRLLVSTDALSHTSTKTYSVVCAPAGTGDAGCYEQTLSVDPNGHQGGTLVDGLGRTAYVQRYTGNSSSTYALYATAKYTYDFAGNLVRIVQPDGVTQTTFGYDMAGRKTSMADPDLGQQTYTYDQDGNLVQSVDARGGAGTIFMGYDGLDRPIWRNTTSGPTGAYDTYGYDSAAGGNQGIGRLTSETFATGSLGGSYAYTYDGRGQQTGSTLTVGGSSYPLGSTYDDAGNVLTQTYPDGQTVTNSYTAQGWLSGVSTSLGATTLASNLTYGANGGAFGEITGATLGGGTYTYAATYDLLDRATDLKTTKTSGGTVMFDQARTFDGTGNALTTNTTMPGATDNQSFCYDEQDRLTWASAATATPPCGGSNTAGTLTAALYTQTFSYDVLGRLTSGPLGTYTYGDPAHVHGATGIGGQWTGTYDAAGNMTCRAPSSSTTCAGTQTGAQLGYNNEGELQSWQDAPSSPTTTAQFLYDGQGQRVEQSVTQGGTTTNTVYVGNVEEVATTSGTTTMTAYYYAGGKRIGLSVNGVISYLASDALGSATVTLSSNGSPTAAQLFAPYGGVRYSSGTMPTSYGYTGQRSDAASGLDYYGARYYDPLAGQFASADSVVPGGGFDLWGLSRYAYVEGNPEVRTDSSGHCYCDVPGTGDNFFPQSGGRLLDGDTGYVYYGPAYRQSYHLVSYTARRHHYAPYRPYAAPAQRRNSVVGAANPGPVDRAIGWMANAVAAPVEADPTEEQRAQSDAADTGWFNDIAGACGLHCPDPSTPEGQAELAIMLGTDGGWISDKQFGKKAAAHMGDFGLDVRDPAQRDAFRKDIIDTRGSPDEIRQGPWNPTAGGGSDYIFYRKGSTVVVTKGNGEFVTILKDGDTNGWYQRAAPRAS